jgi:hypothetical protein
MTISPTSILVTIFSHSDLKFICLPSLAFLFPTYTLLYSLVWLYWWSQWSGSCYCDWRARHLPGRKDMTGASPVSSKTDL